MVTNVNNKTQHYYIHDWYFNRWYFFSFLNRKPMEIQTLLNNVIFNLHKIKINNPI